MKKFFRATPENEDWLRGKGLTDSQILMFQRLAVRLYGNEPFHWPIRSMAKYMNRDKDTLIKALGVMIEARIINKINRVYSLTEESIQNCFMGSKSGVESRQNVCSKHTERMLKADKMYAQSRTLSAPTHMKPSEVYRDKNKLRSRGACSKSLPGEASTSAVPVSTAPDGGWLKERIKAKQKAKQEKEAHDKQDEA